MQRLLGRLGALVRIFAALAGNRDLRNVELAFLAFNAVEYGTWIAILLYAYETSGPTSVGVVALVQLIPCALFAPLAASLGDRIERHRFLLLGYIVEMLTMGIVAAAMFARLEPVLLYGLACIEASALTMTRPAQAALLPALAERPEELTAANGLSAVFEGAGVLAGPLGAAAILAFASPAAVFLAGAGVLAVAALLVVRVRAHAGEVPKVEHDGTAGVSGSPLAGFRLLARQREPRLLVVLLSARIRGVARGRMSRAC